MHKSEWEESNCVVQHIIQNKECNVCLNCEDWVKNKQNGLNEGWSLFEEEDKIDMVVNYRIAISCEVMGARMTVVQQYCSFLLLLV